MKFKVGDKVTVRQWDDMEKEYGLCSSGDSIPIPVCSFVKNMELFCGKKVTIEEVYGNYYGIKEDDCHWCWTDEMFEESKISKNDFSFDCLIRNNKTIIKLPNGKVGIAKCDPKDEFSEGVGVLIATARAYGLNLNEVARLCEKKEPRKIAEVGDYIIAKKSPFAILNKVMECVRKDRNLCFKVLEGRHKGVNQYCAIDDFDSYKILASEEVAEFKKKHKEIK